MSAREIIENLPHLAAEELMEIERRILEITHPEGVGLRAKYEGNRLVLAGPQVVRQASVEAILAELP